MKRSHFPGETLRDRRREKGFTLSQVYEHIKIPPEHLKALEDGRLQAFRVPTYGLGYLNTYCRFLELDPERYLLAYRESCDLPVAPAAHLAPRTQAPAERPAWLSEMITWGAVCAFLLLGWLTYSAVFRPVAEDGETRVDAGTVEVEQELEIAPPPYHFPEEY
jgi:cytoskeletal protein RodZ